MGLGEDSAGIALSSPSGWNIASFAAGPWCAPASLITTGQEELRKFAPELKVLVVGGHPAGARRCLSRVGAWTWSLLHTRCCAATCRLRRACAHAAVSLRSPYIKKPHAANRQWAREIRRPLLRADGYAFGKLTWPNFGRFSNASCRGTCHLIKSLCKNTVRRQRKKPAGVKVPLLPWRQKFGPLFCAA